MQDEARPPAQDSDRGGDGQSEDATATAGQRDAQRWRSVGIQHDRPQVGDAGNDVKGEVHRLDQRGLAEHVEELVARHVERGGGTHERQSQQPRNQVPGTLHHQQDPESQVERAEQVRQGDGAQGLGRGGAAVRACRRRPGSHPGCVMSDRRHDVAQRWDHADHQPEQQAGQIEADHHLVEGSSTTRWRVLDGPAHREPLLLIAKFYTDAQTQIMI